MNKKSLIIISCVALVLVSLTTATYAYYRMGVNGNITGNTGSINLIVNSANANASEEFNITLKRSETEEFIIPGDSGYFDLNVNSTGSVGGVEFTVTIDRTGLPTNLKFYVDEEHTREVNNQSYTISKAETMVKTVRIYWYWADIDDENDSLFIGKNIVASIVISATLYTPTLYDTLLAVDYTLDTNVDFSQATSETNGQGLMMMSSTQNENYPVLYYRGDVTNNNVIFANFCWLIVRTTETGGIKLVFNGPVVENADGTESCTNYSGVGSVTANTNYTDVYAGNTTTKFNTSSDSPVYVGYMYNDANKFYSSSTLDGAGYIAHLSDNNIDQETGRHVQNLKDSTIKGVVDNWYKANILGKPEESLLEDTIWCNDRSVISETYTIENYATNYMINFAARTRLGENTTVTPSLVCSRDMDKFTVDSANGNGDLDYPIGLLTADEINLAGHSSSSSTITYLRLSSGAYQWSLSPYSFFDGSTVGFDVFSGRLGGDYVRNSYGARPSVSLGLGAHVTGGNGTFEIPYLVG